MTADDPSIEVGLLSLILDRHPEHLTIDELIGEARQAEPSTPSEAYRRAIRTLLDAELLNELEGRIVPTRAALHFDALPF